MYKSIEQLIKTTEPISTPLLITELSALHSFLLNNQTLSPYENSAARAYLTYANNYVYFLALDNLLTHRFPNLEIRCKYYFARFADFVEHDLLRLPPLNPITDSAPVFNRQEVLGIIQNCEDRTTRLATDVLGDTFIHTTSSLIEDAAYLSNTDQDGACVL